MLRILERASATVFQGRSGQLLRSQFAKSVGGTLCARLGLIIIGTVTSALVARSLMPEGRGLFAVASTVSAMGIQFGSLGLPVSNTFYVARDRSLLRALLGNSLLVSLVAGILGGIGVWGISMFWHQAVPLRGGLLFLAVLAVPAGIAYMLLQNLLLGIQAVAEYNRIEVIGRSVGLLLIALLAATRYATIELIYGASAVTLVVGSCWSFLSLRRRADGPPKCSWTIYRTTAFYGLKAYLNGFFCFLLLRASVLITSSLAGTRESGYYATAASVSDMIYLLPAVVGTILFPKLAATADERLRWRLAQRATLSVLILTALFSVGMCLLAEPAVILLFGRPYLPAVGPLRILAVAMVFYGGANVLANFMSSIGSPWPSVYVWAGGLLMCTGLNYYLVPKFGASGAAWGLMLSYSSVLVIQYGYALFLSKNYAD